MLDGLNAALAAYTPGHMLEGGWQVALYVDERGDQKQRDALAAVFSGQAGGHLAALGPLIAQVLGVKAVPIQYQENGKKRHLSIPGIAESEIAALAGAGRGGRDVGQSSFHGRSGLYGGCRQVHQAHVQGPRARLANQRQERVLFSVRVCIVVKRSLSR